MAKRKRRPTQPGEFEDPLSNYDPPQYSDDLERMLAEETVEVMNIRPFATVPCDSSIADAIELMAENDFFGLLVVDEDNRLLGIFSERDVLDKVADNYPIISGRPITDVMTRDPVCVYETDSPAKALNLMAIGGFRRVPVLDMNDRIVGIIGPKRTTMFLQEYLG